MKPSVVQMFGLSFNACSLQQAADMIVTAAKNNRKCLAVTLNSDHIVRMETDEHAREIFKNAAFRFADGMPLVWFSKLFLKPSLPERVTGADLLPVISRMAGQKGLKLFLLGGQKGVAERASQKLSEVNRSLQIVGTYCPPFGFEKDPEESGRIVAMINDSGADILFVAVGAPKQEKWASSHMEQLNVGPIIGVGAALDFSAGTVRRAPLAMRRTGLEWLWRLIQEPRRLWRRYLLWDSRFIFIAYDEWKKIRSK